MSLLNLFILGLLISVGGYYLRIYMKGIECPLSNRIDGKNVLITGANTGIGLATAIELASRGGIVHMACRDSKRCQLAREKVLSTAGVDEKMVVTHTVDLASLRSILIFAKSFKETVTKLDILINNAGIMLGPYKETEDGFESQVGVNHLGHFLLTKELLGLVISGDSPRIVIVSSLAHEYGSFDTDDINLRGENYSQWAAYSRSKLANVLHAKVLSRRLKDLGVAVVSVHPGAVATELQREIPLWLQKVYQAFQFLLVKNPKEGAQTSVCCAVNPDLLQHTGEYFNDCKTSVSTNKLVYNETLSEWLWDYSEMLIQDKVSKLSVL